jgi:hypothetical protein
MLPFTLLAPPPAPPAVAAGRLAMLILAQSAKDDVNRITTAFFEFGQGIAAGIAALAILAGFIMIAASHGNVGRAEHGRQAIIAGLAGLVGVALVGGLVELVKTVFPVLR